MTNPKNLLDKEDRERLSTQAVSDSVALLSKMNGGRRRTRKITKKGYIHKHRQ